VRILLALLLAVARHGGAGAAEPAPVAGECGELAGGGTRCLYRSGLPSAGLVAACRSERDCRLGHYRGGIEDVTWLAPPPGLAALPRPEVLWFTSTLAQARVACGPACTWSYFVDARRGRVSPPRQNVLAVDATRQLLVAAEERALVARQVFSGRAVLRIERDFAPGPAAAAVTLARLDPDGRLVVTWLRGASREPVTERISVPSVPRP
jgi:hypothetical protein